jgi:hypothetical protein
MNGANIYEINTEAIITAFKILLGIFMGLLFAYFIDYRLNTLVKGPDSSEIQSKIFCDFDNQNSCYKLRAYPVLSSGIHKNLDK